MAAEGPQYRIYLFLQQQVFSRALIDAAYDAGVLTLRIPVAEQARSRKITIGRGGTQRQIESTV